MNELYIALVGAIVGGLVTMFASRQSALYGRRAETILSVQAQIERIARDLELLAGLCRYRLEEVPTLEALRIIREELPELRNRSETLGEKMSALRVYWQSNRGWFEENTRGIVEGLINRIGEQYGMIRYRIEDIARFEPLFHVDEQGQAISHDSEQARRAALKLHERGAFIYDWTTSEDSDSLNSLVVIFGEEVTLRTVTPLYYWQRRVRRTLGLESHR